MVDQTGSLRAGRSFVAVFSDLFGLPPHPEKWLVGVNTPTKVNTTMNAKARFVVTAHLRLQHFLAQYYTRTPRLVSDQTTPRNTYKPHYVAHRDVTFGRKAGAK